MIWKLLHWGAEILFWGALAWIAWSVVAPGGNRRPARERDGRVVFAPHWLTLATWPVLVAFVAWPYASHVLRHQGISWDYVILACLGFATCAILIEFPGTILVTESGLETLLWLRRNRHIGWKDIVEIEAEKGGAITITAADGTKIVHSRFLADRPRLLLELRRHCGDELPPEFPGAPDDGLSSPEN